MEKRGEDKPAMWAYEAAIESFQEPLTKATPKKRMGVALRLHAQLVGLMGDIDNLHALYQGGPVSWEEVKARRSAVKLEQVLPAGVEAQQKPRL